MNDDFPSTSTFLNHDFGAQSFLQSFFNVNQAVRRNSFVPRFFVTSEDSISFSVSLTDRVCNTTS